MEENQKHLIESDSTDNVTEAQKQQKEAARAAKVRDEQRADYDGEVGKEYPHDDKDTAYMDEKAPKMTVGQILGYVGLGLFILVLALLIYRIVNQKKDYSDLFLWTEEAVSAYNENGTLTVWIQDMSSFTYTLERDENNIPTETYQYTYYPYSQSDIDGATDFDFEGCFMVGDPMYIEETQQFLVTFRVNRTAGKALQEHYSLDTAPSGDVYRFLISDGYTSYTDYSYTVFEKNSYFYYRLIFNDVPYDYIRDLRNIDPNAIEEWTLAVYYTEKFHINSPLDTITVGNNLIPGKAYDIKDALPATVGEDLKQGPLYAPTEEE